MDLYDVIKQRPVKYGYLMIISRKKKNLHSKSFRYLFESLIIASCELIYELSS